MDHVDVAIRLEPLAVECLVRVDERIKFVEQVQLIFIHMLSSVMRHCPWLGEGGQRPLIITFVNL